MKNFRFYFVALGLAAAALSSCGRSYYSFQSKPSAYLGTVPDVAATAPALGAALPVATLPAMPRMGVATVREAAPAATPMASPAVSPPALFPPVEALATVSPAAEASPAPALKLPAGQRLLLRHVLKQADRAAAHQRSTTGVTHTAATKGSLVIALVGLVALVVGIIVSSGFLITVGIIALVVGIVLYLLKIL